MMELLLVMFFPLLLGLVVGYSVGKIRVLRKRIKEYKRKVENLAMELLEEKVKGLNNGRTENESE